MYLFFLTFRSIIEPVRNTGFRQTDHFHLSRAAGIDFTNQVVHVESGLKHDSTYNLSYDKLVIGVGSLSNTFNTPGVTEHAFFLKVN
jgi:NADH:ubiquinone reductase (non-electrogenic)